MRGPISSDCIASFLHRAAQRKSGFADDRVTANMVEDCNLVPVPQESLAAFVIEHDDVIGPVLFVVGHGLRAALAESLYDLGSLRPRTSRHVASISAIGSSSAARNLPGLAVRDEDSGFVIGRSHCGCRRLGLCCTKHYWGG